MADEVGFMMNPCVKRTWAPEAKTPVVPYRNRRQKKVSVIGAVALRHTAAAVAGAAAVASFDLVCDFHPDSYVRSEQAAAFLHRVLAEYKDVPRIDLVWDNLAAHRSRIVKEVVEANPRLTLHYLPPYAPDLNAVEGVWSLSKYHRMANHSIDSVEALHAEAARHLGDIGRDPALLRSCFQGAQLAVTLERAQ
jgi:transposase